MATELKGKVALVTGGASGLGAATCTLLAESGVSIAVADVNLDGAQKVAQQIQAAGGHAQAVYLNVLDAEMCEQVVNQIAQTFGHLDIVVNNAGIDVTVPIEELSVADWDKITGINLRAAFMLSKFAWPIMQKQGGGHIVNIASTAALRAWANAAAYHASKWGIIGLSRALHVEGRQHHIKVSAVLPGGMRTPLILAPDRFPDTPLTNLQEPRNVAEAIRFVLTQPEGTVIPEIMVFPETETSWP